MGNGTESRQATGVKSIGENCLKTAVSKVIAGSRKRSLETKLVYLHELDSVRNSQKEIAFARRRLYEEIFVNGTTPVISFNQLADSRAFLGLVTNPEEKELIPRVDNSDLSDIGNLIKHGRIKIARFSDKRTASQYLQDNLCSDKRGFSEFVLSGWPIPTGINGKEKRKIYETIRSALRNNDPDFINKELNSMVSVCDKDFDGEATRLGIDSCLSESDITQIKQLVIFMLSISKTQLAYADINQNFHPRFEAFVDYVTSHLANGEISIKDVPFSDVTQCCWALSEVRKNISKGINSRSTWYSMLEHVYEKDAEQKPSFRLAHLVLDLCYNIAVESGIDHCSLSFNPNCQESFNAAVERRLDVYKKQYDALNHSYCVSLRFEEESEKECLDWSLLVHIQEALEQRFGAASSTFPNVPGTSYIGLYKQRLGWRRNVTSSLAFQTLGAVLYVLLFGFIEVVVSLVDGLASDTATLLVDENALEVGDLLSLEKTVAVAILFFVGVIAYALLTRNKNNHSIKIPFVGISLIFFVIVPFISCLNLACNETGSIEISLHLENFGQNLLFLLPSLFVGFAGVLVFTYIGSLIENRTGLPGLFDSMKLAKKSICNIWKFNYRMRAAERVYDAWGVGGSKIVDTRNAASRKYDGEPLCEVVRLRDCEKLSNKELIRPNAWDWLMRSSDACLFSDARLSKESSDYEEGNWEDYLRLLSRYGSRDAGEGALSIVIDKDQVKAFEMRSGRKTGIIYDSPYNTLVVDVVKDADNNLFAYERLIPKNTGAVVIVPRYKGKLILLDQYRHALGIWQLGFPRGFGELGITERQNAFKELYEEIGAVVKGDMIYLGNVTPDSGISANVVSVFSCEIQSYDSSLKHEGVVGMLEVTPDELRSMVSDKKITDAFTLSALMLYQAQFS